MKKALVYILVTFLFMDSAYSQVFGSKPRISGSEIKVPVKETSIVKDAVSNNKRQRISIEEVEAIVNKEIPPTTMTAEQKSEIDLVAKKNIRVTLNRQSIRDRKDFIDVMTNTEKTQARRAALLTGKNVEEAKKVEDEIKTPQVDPKSDKEMEQYMHSKAGL